MESLKFRITGVAPLIMHSGLLADPLNKYTRAIKKISANRKKVDADFEDMARLEWYGSLYLKDGVPCLPGNNLEAALIGRGSAARSQKMGKQAAAALIVPDDYPLEYDGPKDIDELWKDERFRLVSKVRIGTASVMRTRPFFKEWAAIVEVLYVPTSLNEDHICQWMEIAGRQVGLCDWRPKYGRFIAEKF